MLHTLFSDEDISVGAMLIRISSVQLCLLLVCAGIYAKCGRGRVARGQAFNVMESFSGRGGAAREAHEALARMPDPEPSSSVVSDIEHQGRQV